MHRYNPYTATAISTRGASRSLSNPSPTSPPRGISGPLRDPSRPLQDGREEDQPEEGEPASRDKADRKKRGPVSEAVIEHRLALHQVDIGTSGTLAFATTLDHAMRCKT